MKLINITIMGIAILFSAQAYGAFQDIIETYDAIYNPAVKGQQNCDELILGDRPDLFTKFEADGTVRVQFRIEEDRGGQPKLRLYVNRKAFRDYFTAKVIPVVPAELFSVHLGDSVLPNINPKLNKDWGLWNRTGYVRRLTVNYGQTEDVLAVAETLQLSKTDNNPSSDEIINIRTSILSIHSGQVTLTHTKKFKNSNPQVPKWMKQTSWLESRKCTFQIVD